MSVLHAPTYRWTVEEYEELGRTGILDANEWVELLNGEIIVMSPIGYRHAPPTAIGSGINGLSRIFFRCPPQRLSSCRTWAPVAVCRRQLEAVRRATTEGCASANSFLPG